MIDKVRMTNSCGISGQLLTLLDFWTANQVVTATVVVIVVNIAIAIDIVIQIDILTNRYWEKIEMQFPQTELSRSSGKE